MAKTNATPAKGAKGAARKDRNDFLGADRWDRILGAAFFGIMLLSVVAFLVLIIGEAAGLFATEANVGFESTLLGIPFIGLPLAIVLLIVLIVRMTIRRRRENKAA